MSSAAREEQCNATPRRRHSIGAIGEGWARKRTAPRRTGNEPIRSGVEQPSWDRLRMATAPMRYATSGDGKVTHCPVMAKQSRGMQRRWTDTGSEGVALRSRAWRRQSEARHGKARRRQSSSEICRATALKCNITRRRSPARQRKGEAEHSGVRDGKAKQPNAAHGDGEARSATKCEGFALLSFAMRRQCNETPGRAEE